MSPTMSIDTTPSQVATNALASLPFGQIIGSPLKAAIEAQAMAAQTTWQFIQEVGLNTDKETGEKKAVNVAFEFIQNGKAVRLNVPLLTIVPIPYIAINSIDIAFKAQISAESSSHNEASESSSTDVAGKAQGKIGFGVFSVTFEASASYSAKKDSKSMQDSKYSVEYTLDVAVKAGQESMPAGLARVLSILNNCISVNNPKGELGASISTTEDGKLQLLATYQNGDGEFKPNLIKVAELDSTISDDGRSAIFDVTSLRDSEAENVTVKAENELTKTLNLPAK